MKALIRPQGALLTNAFAEVVDAEVLDEPDPHPVPTAPALAPAEVRIPSRRKRETSWS